MHTVPLSPSQQGLWFFQQLEPGSGAYNNMLLARLQGDLDLLTLRRSVGELVRRHQALRTCFAVADGVPAQFALDDYELDIPRVDAVPAAADRDHFAAATRLAATEAAKPIELAEGRPPARALLIGAGPGDYLFLLVVHHIVCDAESITTLMRELAVLYTAFAQQRPSPLDDPPLDYLAAIGRRQGQLTEERLNRGIGYWKGQLAGAPPLLALPLDHPRPAAQSSQGSLYHTVLPADLSESLRAFGREHGLTTYMTTLAAFQVLLFRYTGQDDVLIGTPMTGRTELDLRSMVGFLVNTIVLRGRPRAGRTVRQVLDDVRGTTMDALRHSYVPFERVVQALRPPRSHGHHPVFQALLSFNERGGDWLHESSFQIPGLRVSFPRPDIGISRFDLSLCINDGAGSLGVDYEYRSDLFEPATIERMAGHFQVLLAHMLTAPDTPIDELPLLTQAERDLLVGTWGQPAKAEPPARHPCLHQYFEAQAALTPTATAVACGPDHLTYADLDRKANQLAHRLRKLGAGPDRFVLVCLSRSLDLVVALFGVLKAGAAYVFVEPETPRSRVEFVLRDSAAAVVITSGTGPAPLPAGDRAQVRLDLDRDSLGQEPVSKPAEAAAGENLTYAIYTSGSTGIPKAVGIRHSGCAAYLDWAATAFSRQDITGVLASSSPMFDCVLFELFMPLAWGGTAVLAESLLALPELDCPHPVTLMMAAPTVIAELLQSAGLPASIRMVVLSGEAVPRSLPEMLYRCEAIEQVFNIYGISETTTHSTGALLARDPAGPPGAGRQADPVIGRPLAGVSTYILDANLSPVPIGVTGELCIGGSGLARGYLGRPGLTAERFVPDPYGGTAGSRLYRSGDLARFRPTGEIEFLGRADHQVKLRGFRVELGDVESALVRCPGVYDAAVLLREDQPGSKRLVAYAVPEQDAALTAAGLRDLLRDRLPRHEMPAAFVFLPSLPLLANGKVNRKALPVPEPELRESDDGVWRLADAVETQVEVVWNELLGRQETVSWDSFFDLGGDSLLVLVMLTRIQETFGVRVPVGVFMAAPTIEELASIIRGQGWSLSPSCLVKVSGTEGRQRPFFCIHPGGGELYELRYLKSELGERPVYALMPIGWNGEAEPLADIGEMASYYIKVMQEIQPAGPYHLGGYSLGGMIAFEMAQQLGAAGEQTSFLGMFETWPVVDVVCVDEEAYEYESTVSAFEEAKQTGRIALPAEELLYLKSMSHAIPGLAEIEQDLRDKKIHDFDGLCRQLEDMRPKLQQALEQLKEKGLVVDQMDLGEFYRMHEVAAKQIWAISSYRPKPYDGAVALFTGRDTEGIQILERIWRNLVTGLSVERTASDTHSIFFRDPLVAQALHRHLDAADEVIRASGHGGAGIR